MDLESSKTKKRTLDENSLYEVGKKKIKIEIPFLNPMVFYPSFPHVVEKIFNQFDKGSLRSCRKVSKSWLDHIDHRNLLWSKIVKNANGGIKAFKFACRYDRSKILEMLFEKSAEYKIDYNDTGWGAEWTGFHVGCKYGHLKIVEMIIEKSAKFNIKLNAKDIDEKTGFHLACENGHSRIAEMMVQKSAEFKIQLNTKDRYGYTAFHWICTCGHFQTAEMFL